MFTTFAAFAPFAATRSRAGTRAGQMRGRRLGARYPRDRNVAAATHSDITARRYMCCCRPSGRGDEGGARSIAAVYLTRIVSEQTGEAERTVV